MSTKQLTDQQLMELLETKKDEVLIIEHLKEDDVSSFLSFYNITQGSDEANLKDLHKLYKNWSRESMKLKEFKHYLNKTFKIDSNSIFLNKSKAIINQLLIDKLNAKEHSPMKSTIIHNKIETFLNHYQIKNGNIWTKGKELQALYKVYSNKGIPESKFYKLLQLYITTSETINNEIHFRIAPYEETKEDNKKR